MIQRCHTNLKKDNSTKAVQYSQNNIQTIHPSSWFIYTLESIPHLVTRTLQWIEVIIRETHQVNSQSEISSEHQAPENVPHKRSSSVNSIVHCSYSNTHNIRNIPKGRAHQSSEKRINLFQSTAFNRMCVTDVFRLKRQTVSAISASVPAVRYWTAAFSHYYGAAFRCFARSELAVIGKLVGSDFVQVGSAHEEIHN